MPIRNIDDRRSNRYNVKVMVIFIDSSKDNWREGASQFPFRNAINYLRIGETTIADAIGYINQEYPNDDITMRLFDLDVNYHDYSTILREGDRYVLPKDENQPILS